ncbi:ABC transporter permease subunit [Streptomyces sp. NPDC001380]|uniref:ABC transporter permease subunit n=1 Tax=Streptomyces sp. NPDC001380 TaxID=3364566 RepID=UPI00367D57EE
MNPTVARLTVHGLLGRRRGLLLLVVPALLLLLAVLVRATKGQDHDIAVQLLGGLALGTLVPLLGLISGTGAISSEIDDGSIVYLLAKPEPRWRITVTKLAVAVGCTAVFAALPTLLAGLVLYGTADGLAVAYALGALAAGTAYSALFLLLGTVTRHAVVAGLMYCLVWESLVGNFVHGARTLSVQQWGLALARAAADPGAVTADVPLSAAVPLLVLVTLAATAAAAVRLAGLTLAGEE